MISADHGRRQFEEWARTRGYATAKDERGAYFSTLTQEVHAAWCAAITIAAGGRIAPTVRRHVLMGDDD